MFASEFLKRLISFLMLKFLNEEAAIYQYILKTSFDLHKIDVNKLVNF